MRLGFLINPIAGMGGRVGLKGTDGVIAEAVARGAEPVANKRAFEALQHFVELLKNQNQLESKITQNIEWFTCAGAMGFDVLKDSGLVDLENNSVEVVYEPDEPTETTANDTIEACQQFLIQDIELVVFCGGDGTARDIFSVVEDRVLMLGIPSGVKMHSGVFATHAHSIGELLISYLTGELDSATGEILDLDEEQYRAGDWNIRLFGVAKTPHDPTLIQRGKHMIESVSEDEIKEEISEYIEEELSEHPEIMYILGSGSTLQTISSHLGIESSLLGIDAMYKNQLIGKDLNEGQLLELLKQYPEAKLILSPIGAQGFILGRGNLQLSPEVIRMIGINNIEVVSTPAKLETIEVLRVDTNDPELDAEFLKKGWFPVIIGYRQMKLKKLGL